MIALCVLIPFFLFGILAAYVDGKDRGFKFWRFVFIAFFWLIIDLWYMVKR